MTITVNGNHSKAYLGNASSGNGIQNLPMGMGWVAITANTAADTYVVPISSILMSTINQGIFFQSETGATVEFTLCNTALATNPDPATNGSVVWGNSTTIPANTIVPAPVLFTACKITFTAPGTVYLGVR